MKQAIVLCLLAVVVQVSATTYTPTKFITHNGKNIYVHGINVPWFNGDYGHDIGNNEITHYSVWYNSATVNSYFSDIASLGFNVMRIWIMEGLEGLIFDSSNLITGLDSTFLSNLDNLVSLASQHNLMIYMMMIDTGITSQNPILTNSQAQTYYLNNALGPIVKRYKGNNAIFAVDCFNEIESQIAGDTGNWGTTGCTWTQARNFMSACASTVKENDPTRLVSSSSGWHDNQNVKSGLFSGLGFDFYDFHSYTNTASLAAASSIRSDLPVIVGEFGAVFTNNEPDDSLETTVDVTYMQNNIQNGYAGGLVWSYGEPSDTDVFSFLNADGSHRPVAAAMKTFNDEIA
jgi:hypothetical protein